MYRMLRFELHRAIFNFRFLIALICGCVLAILQFYHTVVPLSGQLDDLFGNFNNMKGSLHIPYNPYESWIEADFNCAYSLIFFMIMPLLSTLPHGISYFEDMKSGYIRLIMPRKDKKAYYVSKCLAVSVSAFVVIVIPLLLNLFLAMTKLPAISPDIATSSSSITSRSILWSVYYEHPLVHALTFILLDGIYGALFGLISFIVSDFAEHGIVVMLFPFILNVFLLALFDTLNLSEASTIYFLRAGWDISDWIIVGSYPLVILVLTVLLCHLRKEKSDVF